MIPDKNKIAKTLSENPITPEMVFAACEQIAAEFLTGGLAGELAPLLKNMDQETIWGYLGKFGTWELKKRLERELDEQSEHSRESHKRLWDHNEEQDNRLDDHERRIHDMEKGA